MDIVEDHALSLEETFVYLVGIGKSKSDAYRAIVDCSELSNEQIASRAWKYSMKPSVLSVSSVEQDNLYAKYARGRDTAFNTLIELTTDAASEFVRQQSANALISQTAKLAKLNVDVNLNIKSEMADALDELRSLLLSSPTGETPQGFLPEDKKEENKNIQYIESVPETKLNIDVVEKAWGLKEEVIINDAYGMPYTNDANHEVIETVLVLDGDEAVRSTSDVEESVLTLDGTSATAEVIEEQLDGINPKSVRKGNGENCKTTGSTGNFRDVESGKFVSNDTARLRLEEMRENERAPSATELRDELAKMIKDKQDEFKNK